MKRRVLSFVLALVLAVSVLPVSAFASTQYDVTSAGVELIKDFEGFFKYPYWDNTQYSVGYGTRCSGEDLERYQKYGITEEEADKILREFLQSFEGYVNRFLDKYDLEVTQEQFDALLSFTYNVGNAWMNDTDATMTQAIINQATGSELIFAMVQWCVSAGKVEPGLIRRRLCEANLYLNGVYNDEAPANYCYVIFSQTACTYKGKDNNIRIQGYDANEQPEIYPEAVKSGYRFLGWYTAETDGAWITNLDASLNGKTLYPHFQQGEGNVSSSGVIQGTKATYSRTMTDSVTVYSTPSTSASKQGTLSKGEIADIVADYVTADGVKWGKLSKGGWIMLNAAASDDSASGDTGSGSDHTGSGSSAKDQVIATGTVKVATGTLNVRSGAGTGYTKVGTLPNGDKVEIYEITKVNGTEWGRISNGWISLAYVELDKTASGGDNTEEKPPVQEEPAKDQVIATGAVKITSGSLNIREGAGSSYKKVGTLANGAKVEIYEIVTADGAKWGRISKGWICMTYVSLDETAPESKPVSTGTVVGCTQLNVRAKAGTGYAIVAKLPKGTTVTIYETTKVGSVTWGRIEQGWVSMDYIKLNTSTGTGTEDTSKPETKTAARTGVVANCTQVNIRSGAGVGNSKVGTIAVGTKVELTALTLKDEQVWGKTQKGWICLDYVRLDDAAVGDLAMVSNAYVNIRAGAGTSYKKVDTYAKGDVITILEIKTVGATKWARTDKGWVSMDYVL